MLRVRCIIFSVFQNAAQQKYQTLMKEAKVILTSDCACAFLILNPRLFSPQRSDSTDMLSSFIYKAYHRFNLNNVDCNSNYLQSLHIDESAGAAQT